METLNLKEYQFPKVTGVDVAFSTLRTDDVLLKEAEARGFNKSSNPYCMLFSTIFFNGGKVKFKESLDPSFKERAWPYFRALIGSFSPKHEHKQAVCAMILSELVEPELDNA
jgi:hypothetical protein